MWPAYREERKNFPSFDGDFTAMPGVREYSSQIPNLFAAFGLSVVLRVHRATGQGDLAFGSGRNLHSGGPQRPSIDVIPLLGLICGGEIGRNPRLTIVRSHIYTDNTTPTAAVRISEPTKERDDVRKRDGEGPFSSDIIPLHAFGARRSNCDSCFEGWDVAW